MLNETIKAIRKSKGLSQEELAVKLNVVRQTISKWEKGLSVPDSDMLISISEALKTSVSTLLGDTIAEETPNDIRVLSEKLEVINLQMARKKATRQRIIHWCFISLCAIVVVIFALLVAFQSSYLEWDYTSPETAVIGVGIHSLEWLFVRIAPFAFIGGIVGAVVTKKRG